MFASQISYSLVTRAMKVLLLARNFRVTKLFSSCYLCHRDLLLLLLVHDVCVMEIFFYFLSRYKDLLLLVLSHNVCVTKLFSCMPLDIQRVVSISVL